MHISEIKPYEFNNRKHPEEQIEIIMKSIEEFGWTIPILIDENNVIIAGHGRLIAAKRLGIDDVPVIQKTDYTDEQKRAYRILDNEIPLLAQKDYNNLELELGLLEDLGLDLEEWKLDDILPDLDDKEVTEDSGPGEEPSETFIKLGDLIELGRHVVHCADATKLNLKGDYVVTDPPYGISVVKSNMVGADFGVASKGKYEPLEGDQDIPDIRFVFEIAEHVLIWGGNYFTEQVPPSGSWLVWDKRGDSGIENTFADCELAFSNFGGPARVYRQLWNGMIREGEKEKRQHPTQKPVELMAFCIRRDDKAEMIVDPFLGSGSTLIACEQLDRTCYGIEIEPKYCHVITDRYYRYCIDNKKEPVISINGELIDWAAYGG